MILTKVEAEYPYIGPGEKFNQYEYIFKRMKADLKKSEIDYIDEIDENAMLNLIQREWNQTCIKYFKWKRLIDDSQRTLRTASRLFRELQTIFKSKLKQIINTLDDLPIKELHTMKRKTDLKEEFYDRMNYMRL